MFRKRWTVILLAIGLLVLPLSGGAAKKKQIVWWSGAWLCQKEVPGEHQAYDLEEVFEKEYPDIDLKVVPIPWEGMYNKMLIAAKTGNVPDLMSIESFLGWTQEFASAGNLKDLTDFMVNEIGEDTFYRGVLEGCKYEGSYYVIPYRNSVRALVYNKNMFEAAGLGPSEPPETWYELLDYAKKLTKDTDGDGVIDQYGFGYPVARFCTVAPEYLRSEMRAFDADILSEDMTKCTMNTPEAKKAIRFWTDLVTKYHVVSPEVVSYSDDDDWRTFGAGATAMAMVGPWAIETYDRLYPDLDYGVAMLPSLKRGVPGSFGMVHMGWCVGKGTQHWEAVKKFMKFALRPEIDAWLTDSLPAVKASTNAPAWKERLQKCPGLAVYTEQLEHSYPSILLLPGGPQIAREVNLAIQRIILGADFDTVINEATTIIDELLQKKW